MGGLGGSDPPCGRDVHFCLSATAPEKAAVGAVLGFVAGDVVGVVVGAIAGSPVSVEFAPPAQQ